MRTLLTSIALLSLLTAPLSAQDRSRDRSQALRQAGSSRGQLSNFGRKAPQVGQRLPSVKLLQADGSPIDLRDLKGNYTVLVFGCLT